MSTPVKPPVKSIDFGAAAAMVEEFAREKNIPTKQFPADVPPVSKGEGSAPARPKAASRSPTRKFTVDMPDYLVKALNMKAAETTSTSRFFVLQGLRAIGFTVREEDMAEDGRRRSG